MSTNNDELLYDEDDSVKFIQNYLPQELKGKFSNDDINYIVDLIYDFYESNGMLDDDGDDEIEIEEFVRTINGNRIYIPAVTLKNLKGKTLGAIVAKIPDKLHTYAPA